MDEIRIAGWALGVSVRYVLGPSKSIGRRPGKTRSSWSKSGMTVLGKAFVSGVSIPGFCEPWPGIISLSRSSLNS